MSANRSDRRPRCSRRSPSIPVDTPYLIAGFEPIPFDAFATMWRAVEPVIGESLETLMRTGGTSPVDRVLESVIREMDGK